MNKICTKCKKEQAISEFTKDSSKKDGYYSSCKDCYRKRLGITKKDPNYIPKLYKYRGRQRMHRSLMEEHLGRKLKRHELVHHINGDRLDNRLGNLQVMTHAEHSRHHYEEIKHKFVSNFEREKICAICNKKFICKSARSKYCSEHCIYVSRKEYLKKWVSKNKEYLKEYKKKYANK
jgi:hypothetical protein